MPMTRIFVTASLLISLAAHAAQGNEVKAAVPSSDKGSYSPKLTAKEAVLTNWKLAVSGLRAGKYVSDQVAASKDSDFARLADQAEFAAETLLLRYASSYWLFAMDDTLEPIDSAILLDALTASRVTCTGPCDAEIDKLQQVFAAASDALETSASSAERAAEARGKLADSVALAEILSDMASYLDSPAWYSNLTLTSAGMDGEEVSARIIGTLAAWRNIEPFVGLKSQEIDTAINAKTDRLMRDVRRNTRRKSVIAPDGPEVEIMGAAARDAAVELRRAAALFPQG